MVQSFYSSFLFSLYPKPETLRKHIPTKISLSRQVHGKSPDITIKATIEAMRVILLLTLKTFLSAVVNFWKTPSKITFRNLGSLQGEYLWRCYFLVKLLPLRITSILPMILKLMNL